jgi:hypothetical protein
MVASTKQSQVTGPIIQGIAINVMAIDIPFSSGSAILKPRAAAPIAIEVNYLVKVNALPIISTEVAKEAILM